MKNNYFNLLPDEYPFDYWNPNQDSSSDEESYNNEDSTDDPTDPQGNEYYDDSNFPYYY